MMNGIYALQPLNGLQANEEEMTNGDVEFLKDVTTRGFERIEKELAGLRKDMVSEDLFRETQAHIKQPCYDYFGGKMDAIAKRVSSLEKFQLRAVTILTVVVFALEVYHWLK